MGIVAEEAVAIIPSTKLRAQGPLLITHWGIGGPAILKLLSYAARHLAERQYKAPLAINWLGLEGYRAIACYRAQPSEPHASKSAAIAPEGLTMRHWTYLAGKAIDEKEHEPLGDLNQKELNRPGQRPML